MNDPTSAAAQIDKQIDKKKPNLVRLWNGTLVVIPTTAGPFELVCGDMVFVSERPEEEAVELALRLLGGAS